MACCCSHKEGSQITIDDAEKSRASCSSASDNEINILYHSSCNDEQENVKDNCSCNDADDDICKDLIFVDGNNDDVEACEYEDTLMERVWLSCKPPKIPKQSCEIPARRIQIMKERLSPTVKGLSETLKDQGIKKSVNTRQKIESDIDYVRVNHFQDEKRVSCQKKTVTIVPECAIKLGDLF